MLNMKKIRFLQFEKHQLFLNPLDWGTLVLRVIPSFYMFNYHGFKKISGTGSWEWLGEAALSLIGIEIGFMFFGFLAAFSEGVLSWFVIFGIFTRLSSVFLMITMFFASVFHLAKGDTAEIGRASCRERV